LIAAGLLALWARRWDESVAARVAAPFFLLLYYSFGYWHTAQPDAWAGMLLLAASVIFMTPRPVGASGRFIAGVLVGLCFAYKTIFLLFVVPFFAFDFWRVTGPIGVRVRGLAVFAGGVLVSVVVMFMWLWTRGALADYVDIQFGFNRHVHQEAGAQTIGQDVFSTLLVLGPLAPFSVFGLARSRSLDRNLFRGLVVFLLSGFLCVCIQQKFYRYHWLVLLAPLSILVALGIAQVTRMAARSGYREGAGDAAGMVVSVLLLALLIQSPLTPWMKLMTGRFTREYFDAGFREGVDYSFAADRKAADYLRGHTQPKDRIVVWGFEPLIYYMADRQSATRFGFNYELILGEGFGYRSRYRQEFMAALQKTPPAYLLVVDRDVNSIMSQSSKESLNDFPEFRHFMMDRYVLETRVGDFAFWRRAAG